MYHFHLSRATSKIDLLYMGRLSAN